MRQSSFSVLRRIVQPVSSDVGGAAAAVATEFTPAGRVKEQIGMMRSLALVSAATAIAVLISGYHPYAEDGGIYLPGVFRLLDPALYPKWTAFVTVQSRFSLFPSLIAGVVRISGVNVMTCVLVVYVASIWTTVYAGWEVLVRCCRSCEACVAGVSIFALCLTAPIAGTSLILLDPYVTARSISTPCSLAAIVGALDSVIDFKRTGRVRTGSAALCGISLLVATLMHPLMAGYAAGCVVLLVCSSMKSAMSRRTAIGSVAALSVVVAAVVDRFAPSPPENYNAAALTRYYWFLSQWRWYEIAGLIAPLILLFALSRYRRFNECALCLSRMCISAGVIGLLVSVLFARESARSYSVAMLQPLRVFLIIYVVMFLLTGAMLAEVLLKRQPLRWAVIMTPLAVLMFFVQTQTYAHSSHLELPWTSPRNDWERGFLWIKQNTPKEATFALDAKYILIPGEDAQNFRAIAERSSPADYQKDGGLAAIEPGLTPDWIAGQSIQDKLAESGDAQRRMRLAQAGVGWLVLPGDSVTGFPCPYQNSAMKVCRLPDR